MRKPAVAYLTSRMPAPPLSGGQLREYNLLQRVIRSFDVHLWVVTMFPEICSTGVTGPGNFRLGCRTTGYSVAEAAQLTGFSRDLLYDQMRRENLRYVKIGRRRLITRQHLEQFLGDGS